MAKKDRASLLPWEEGWDVDPFEPLAPWDEFYAAMGRFTQMFKKLESGLNAILRNMIFELTGKGQQKDRADYINALVGSLKIGGLRDSMKRVLRVASIDTATFSHFEYAFNQLGEIHFMRDRIFHHGSGFIDDKFCVSNDDTVPEYTQSELIMFDIEDILNMAYDSVHLLTYFDILEESMGRDFEHKDKRADYLLKQRPTWRYKSSLLTKMGPKHWPKPRELKHQPAPSHKKSVPRERG